MSKPSPSAEVAMMSRRLESNPMTTPAAAPPAAELTYGLCVRLVSHIFKGAFHHVRIDAAHQRAPERGHPLENGAEFERATYHGTLVIILRTERGAKI